MSTYRFISKEVLLHLARITWDLAFKGWRKWRVVRVRNRIKIKRGIKRRIKSNERNHKRNKLMNNLLRKKKTMATKMNRLLNLIYYLMMISLRITKNHKLKNRCKKLSLILRKSRTWTQLWRRNTRNSYNFTLQYSYQMITGYTIIGISKMSRNNQSLDNYYKIPRPSKTS